MYIHSTPPQLYICWGQSRSQLRGAITERVGATSVWHRLSDCISNIFNKIIKFVILLASWTFWFFFPFWYSLFIYISKRFNYLWEHYYDKEEMRKMEKDAEKQLNDVDQRWTGLNPLSSQHVVCICCILNIYTGYLSSLLPCSSCIVIYTCWMMSNPYTALLKTRNRDLESHGWTKNKEIVTFVGKKIKFWN